MLCPESFTMLLIVSEANHCYDETANRLIGQSPPPTTHVCMHTEFWEDFHYIQSHIPSRVVIKTFVSELTPKY
jgi:hypothetical protein